ncbi:SGNH/GDSL hydrolase family protein [Roseicella aerolata]|uniref:SGNH/GDSL hydrolase family protein n=1 Tax=Roseicella aerolata TaxID=2883479 RepID=A0A9X1LDN0_9PROT|nr:SGNH/GDSL hydrolase family protein [Roseicella aerolata]MCB4825353.1 SGNH/GDSL hydrolase family protein [Roseicella aerolata]
MGHVVLLGDSVFDNGAYVAPREPDVVQQLRDALPGGWRASLAAVDGAVTGSVPGQLGRLPPDATHLVVSVGGNDALQRQDVLERRVRSVAEALVELGDVRDAFARDYRVMLDAVLGRGLPTAVCTIYDPRFPDPMLQRVAVAALAMFNDVITREAFRRRLPLVDLRLVCSDDEHYANPIEPSARGGARIAAGIAELVTGHDFARRRAEVFARD